MEAFNKALDNYKKDGNRSNGAWLETCAKRVGISKELLLEYLK